MASEGQPSREQVPEACCLRQTGQVRKMIGHCSQYSACPRMRAHRRLGESLSFLWGWRVGRGSLLICSFNPSPELDGVVQRLFPFRWGADEAQRGKALDLNP